MDHLSIQHPQTIDGKEFEINSRTLYPKDEYRISLDWDSINEWILWITWIEIYVIGIVVLIIACYVCYLRYANRSSIVYCKSHERMDGKTVLVTANTTGIGFAAAKLLADRGARVILACNDIQGAQKIADTVDISNRNEGLIQVKKLDTSSLKSVTYFVDDFLKREKRLDVLILASHIGGSKKKIVSEDGLEKTMATNYFGHFLLVNLLLNLLKSSAPSRVVIVASSAHYLLSSVNSKDLNFNSIEYGAMSAYAQSMACNILMANNLAHMTENEGIVVNSACGGMLSSQPYLLGGGIIPRIYRSLLRIASRTDEEGAQTLVYLSVSEVAGKSNGAYFTDCTEKGLTQLGKDSGLAKKVWESCEEIVGLNGRHH